MRAESFRVFDEPIGGIGEVAYVAVICGRPLAGGTWEAWIEFVPEQGGARLRSRRETTQSNRQNLEAWAARVRRVYLEGCLRRTLELEQPRARREPPPAPRPRFDGPAPESRVATRTAPDDAAFSPFLHYRKGEERLRTELQELSAVELRIVIRAYDLAAGEDDPEALAQHELVELIVAAVRRRMRDRQ